MAGIGTLLVAQDRLQHVEIVGCPTAFLECFVEFGVCSRCLTACNASSFCPKMASGKRAVRHIVYPACS